MEVIDERIINAIKFLNYIREQLSDFEFCKKRWPDDTNETIDEEGEVSQYNYYHQKFKVMSGGCPVTLIYSLSDGDVRNQLIEIWFEWSKGMKDKKLISPFNRIIIALLYNIEFNLTENDIKDCMKEKYKESTIKKFCDHWYLTRVGFKVTHWYKELHRNARYIILNWAFKRVDALKKEQKYKSDFSHFESNFV